MGTYAIVNNDIVENIAEADSLEILQLLLPGKTVIEETSQTGLAWIGSEVILGRFKPFQKYKSWSFDNDIFDWVPPIAQPNYPSYWNEDTLSWIEIELPTVEEENAN